jgi:hypothetical protein
MNFHLPRPATPPPHRIPGLFDIPDVGRRRVRAELAELVENLRAPLRHEPSLAAAAHGAH